MLCVFIQSLHCANLPAYYMDVIDTLRGVRHSPPETLKGDLRTRILRIPIDQF